MKRVITVILLMIAYHAVQAQQKQPFFDEIQQFKKEDSVHKPPKHAILFVGSSSFRKWTDVQSYFPETIINRGFGGSQLTDVIYYANDIIIPYHPRQVVIYCGDNDLAASDTVTAQTVFERFVTLFDIIRKAMPGEPVMFVSVKPSPSRVKLMICMSAANKMIKDFLKTKQHTVFIDVYHKMLDKDGEPMKDLFLEDSLHMNAKGYHIWQKAMAPYLLK